MTSWSRPDPRIADSSSVRTKALYFHLVRTVSPSSAAPASGMARAAGCGGPAGAAGPPEVELQPALLGPLPAALGGVEDGDAECPALLEEAGGVVEHAGQRLGALRVLREAVGLEGVGEEDGGRGGDGPGAA